MKRILFLLTLVMLFFACKEEKKQTNLAEDESGFAIKYCRTSDKEPTTKVGDIIVGELQIRLNDSTILHSNYGSVERLFTINDEQHGTIDKYLLNLHIGDSVIITTPAHYLDNNLVGMKFRQKDKLFFYLKVSQIITKKQLTEQEQQAAIKQEQEQSRIAEYVKEHFPQAKLQTSGIYLDVTTPTNGTKATSGSTVKVYYSVCDLEGKVYDTNIKSVAKKANIYDAQSLYQPYEFMVGSGETIAGFSEGVSLMHQGETATIIIPSKLGYGEQQNGPIKPFTTLIFTVELLSVK
jgi:FKBP-type peptidyl-prolyl cis-trans isomerase